MSFVMNRRSYQFCYQMARKFVKNQTALPYSTSVHRAACIPHTEDKYGGVHVKVSSWPDSVKSFGSALSESMLEWKKSKYTAVWIEVPLSLSTVIPVLAGHGFQYHHAEGDTAVLYQWIDEENSSLLPRYATHQVGVSGCVVNEELNQVLVIKERHRKNVMWKFPGGLSDLGEDISETAEREVYEETGVRTKFQGVLTFRQQHDQPGAFGRSDLYFVCHMTPMTFDLHPCSREIEACAWIDIDKLADDVTTSAMTLRVLQLVRKAFDLGFDKVTFRDEEFKSIYKGRKFKMFSTPVDELTHYAYHLADDSIMKKGLS